MYEPNPSLVYPTTISGQILTRCTFAAGNATLKYPSSFHFVIDRHAFRTILYYICRMRYRYGIACTAS